MMVNNRLRWNRVAVILAIIWFGGILAIFYSVQKPFYSTNPQAILDSVLNLVSSYNILNPLATLSALLDSLLNLAVSLSIFLLASGLGWRILKSMEFPSPDTRLIFASGTGLGIFSLVTLGLGMGSLLYREIFIAIVVLLFFVFRRETLDLLRAIPDFWSPPRLPKLFILYMATTLAISLLAALTPPAHSFDSLLYHLAGPRLFLDEHRILAPADPDLYFPFFFPSLGEMLFLLAMLIKGDIAAQILHYLFGVLLAAALFLFTRQYLLPRAGWVPIALVWSMPLVPLIMGWAYVDLALAFYEFLAFWGFVLWLDSPQRGYLLLAAACAGFALGVKYTGFVAPLALVLIVLYHNISRRRRSISTSAKSAILFAGFTLLVAMPWYLRNFNLVGNPVYPFFFGGQGWDEWLSRWYEQPGSGLGIDLVRILSLALTVTLGVEDETFFDGRIGPLYLGLLPLIFIARFLAQPEDARKRQGIARYLLFVSFLHLGFWTLGVMASHSLFQGRLLLSGLVFLSPVLALSLEQLWSISHPQLSPQRLFYSGVCLVLLLGLATQALEFLDHNPLPYLLGWQSREEYLEQNLREYYQAMKIMGQNLPDTAVVQFLWEPRTYYCSRVRVCRPDAILGFFKHEVYRAGSAGGIVEDLRERGVTHLLVYEWGRNHLQETPRTALTPEEQTILQELVGEHLQVIYADENENYRLYALR